MTFWSNCGWPWAWDGNRLTGGVLEMARDLLLLESFSATHNNLTGRVPCPRQGVGVPGTTACVPIGRGRRRSRCHSLPLHLNLPVSSWVPVYPFTLAALARPEYSLTVDLGTECTTLPPGRRPCTRCRCPSTGWTAPSPATASPPATPTSPRCSSSPTASPARSPARPPPLVPCLCARSVPVCPYTLAASARPEYSLIVYQCTRTHSPHPPPRPGHSARSRGSSRYQVRAT